MSLDKKDVRHELLQIRKAFGSAEVVAKSQLVCEHILQSALYAKAHCIMGFLAFGTEISIDRVLQDALNSNKIIAVPYILSKSEFRPAQFTGFVNLEPDRYGIRTIKGEPHFLEPKDFDLVLVPGVGFSVHLERMGMGAGYYDRFLSQTKGFKLGVTCNALVKDVLPVATYDINMDAIVTEAGILYGNKN
jgi:5-formyltetrahydrofolate cyclo-ligase